MSKQKEGDHWMYSFESRDDRGRRCYLSSVNKDGPVWSRERSLMLDFQRAKEALRWWTDAGHSLDGVHMIKFKIERVA